MTTISTVLLLFVALTTTIRAFIVHPDEIEFLESLYNAWGGKNIPGRRFSNWNFTKNAGGNQVVPPCQNQPGLEWEYLSCNFGATTAFVTAFDYTDTIDDTFVLSSTIPARISSMTGLVSFTISNQALRGTIPDGISSLTALTTLDLSGNSLSGTIPEDLSDSLTSLSLADNHFGGTLGANLTHLTNLGTLYLQGNSMSGSLPSAFLSKFPTLQFMSLG